MKIETNRMTRRRMLQTLTALGVTGSLSVDLTAKDRREISPQILKAAMSLLDQDYDDARLTVIATALQRRLDEMQLIRDLDLDDQIEPAPVFMAKGW